MNDYSNLTSKLYKFAVKNDNSIVKLLDEKRVSEAVILANDVLVTMSQADKTVKIQDRIKVRLPNVHSNFPKETPEMKCCYLLHDAEGDRRPRLQQVVHNFNCSASH